MAGCRPDPVAHQVAGEALAHRERELAERDTADAGQDVLVPRAGVALQRPRREVRLGPVGPPFLACEVGEQHLAAVERGDLAHAPASAHLGIERLSVALATDDARPVPARFSPSHSPLATGGLLDAHRMRPPGSGCAIVRPRGRGAGVISQRGGASARRWTAGRLRQLRRRASAAVEDRQAIIPSCCVARGGAVRPPDAGYGNAGMHVSWRCLREREGVAAMGGDDPNVGRRIADAGRITRWPTSGACPQGSSRAANSGAGTSGSSASETSSRSTLASVGL